MVKIVIVKKTGVLENASIKKHGLEDLCKKCGYKKKDDFQKHIDWCVTLKKQFYHIEMYGKDKGRATYENKYDFPPPVDTLLLFGDCLLLNKDKDDNPCDLTTDQWEQVYEYLFGGFEDLDATAEEDDKEEDELEDIPDDMKTKEGYLKDGFVVDGDDDIEDEDDDFSELEEEEYEYDDDD